MAEFESSPEAATLARVAELHRQEHAPDDFRGRVARQIARLALATPPAHAHLRRRRSQTQIAWIPLLTAVAAISVWVLGRERSIIPGRESSTPQASVLPVSFAGSAVPGSLRWRQFAEPNGDGALSCEYHFALRPQGSQTELGVFWKRCEFPASLREVTAQDSSSAAEVDVRVLVSGTWSGSGELQATTLRVLTP